MSGFFIETVFGQERILQGGEKKGERNHAEQLEAHPDIGGLRAPYDLVQDRKREEKKLFLRDLKRIKKRAEELG